MQLRDYLRLRGETVKAFAARIGFSEPAVAKWVYDQRNPRDDTKILIYKATHWEVRVEDWTEPSRLSQLRSLRKKERKRNARNR